MLCGRILEPPPDRGCVRRTSRSKCGCAKSLNDSKTRGLAVPLRLVLRTQPRSVSARFWWWFQDAPVRKHRGACAKSIGQRLRPALQFLQKGLDERRQLPRPERGERHGGETVQGDRADSGRQLGSGNGDRQTDAVAALHVRLNQRQ